MYLSLHSGTDLSINVLPNFICVADGGVCVCVQVDQSKVKRKDLDLFYWTFDTIWANQKPYKWKILILHKSKLLIIIRYYQYRNFPRIGEAQT